MMNDRHRQLFFVLLTVFTRFSIIETYSFSSSIDHLLYLKNSSTLFAISSSHLHQLQWSTTNETLLLLHRRVQLHHSLDQTDRGVSVFLYHSPRHVLMVCARSSLGQCVLYDAQDISRVYQLDSQLETNYLGCLDGCLTFLSSSNVIRTALAGHRHGNVINSRLELDQDLLHFNLKYHSNDLNAISAVKFHSTSTSTPEFVFGFDYEDFSYYLIKSSRLARVCQSSIAMSMSYEEIPLIPCDQRSTISSAFFIFDQLYVVYDDLLCLYYLDEIDRAFQSSARRCHQGQGYRLDSMFNISQGRVKCEQVPSSELLEYHQCIWQSYRINSFIDGLSGVNGIFLYRSNGMIQFVFVDRSLIILGTDQGQIFKFIRRDHKNVILLHQLTYRTKALSRHYVVDEKHQALLLAVGTELHRYAYNSCSLYDTCQTCIASRRYDQQMCQWGSGRCSSALSTLFGHYGCPPIIEQIHPVNASVNTEQVLLKINGSFYDVALPLIKVTVTFPLPNQNHYSCFIQTITNRSLTCFLFIPKQPMEGLVSIQIQPGRNLSSADTDLSGSVEYPEKFHVYIPQPVLVPPYGPRAGGTKIQIHQLDFYNQTDLFSTMKIWLGNENCPILRFDETSNMVECLNSPCSTDHQRLELKITVGYRAWLLQKTFFQCRPNPIVIDWNPKRATISGGYEILINGENLDVIQNPRMKLVSKSLNFEWIESCSSRSATQMNCSTPAIKSDRKFLLPLNLEISFLMDNIHFIPEEEILIILDDPIYHPFEKSKQQINVTGLVHIEGSNLATSHSIEQLDIRIDQIHNACLPLNLTDTDLFCRLSTFAANQLKSLQPSMEIHLGQNLIFRLGQIFFEDTTQPLPLVVQDSSSRFAPWTILLILIVSSLTIFILFSTIIMLTHYRLHRSSHDFHSNDRPPSYLTSVWSNFNKQWLIKRRHLTIFEKVGQGCFTDVHRGQWKPTRKKSFNVFVVILRDRANPSMSEFLLDIDRVKDFSHPNLLPLLGISWDGSRQALIVYPSMIHGDLRTYLSNENHQPSMKQLLTWAIEIADAMEYLISLNYIHRQLACRHCLLDDQWICHLADFSLSPDYLDRDYYLLPVMTSDPDGKGIQNKPRRVPIRWLSPEAIESSQYTSQSDVWSFGIFLWELFNRGKTPYPIIENSEIYSYIKRGYRLASPPYCPSLLYQSVMIPCWNDDPMQRPSFTQLAHDLRYILHQLDCDQSSSIDDDTTIIQCYPISEQTQQVSLGLGSDRSAGEDVQLLNQRPIEESLPMSLTASDVFNPSRLLPVYTETSIVQNSE